MGLPEQLYAGRLYGLTREHHRKLAFARDGIQAMARVAPGAYLSLSFGKQSLCVAHLLWSLGIFAPMYFLASDESWVLHNFGEVIEEFCARYPIDLHIVQTHHYDNPAYATWQEARLAGRYDLERMCDRRQFGGLYMGLAKDESQARRRTLSEHRRGAPHPTILPYTDGTYRCCPLMNWTWVDLAAYIVAYNLPLLDEYHRHGLEARTTARVTGRMLDNAGLAKLKHTNLAAYSKLVARFPELSRFT